MKDSGNIEVQNQDLFEFIERFGSFDPIQLKLKYGKLKFDFSLDFAILQISLRQHCSKKLPSFLKNTRFLFPDKIASEQSTDEKVALYHASLISQGSRVIDMTSGLGIDAMTFASKGAIVTAIELNNNKSRILVHNSGIMGFRERLTVICADSVEYAKEKSDKFDLLFIDPARRGADNKRTYSFHDCEPDVIINLSLLFKLSDRMLIKASPLLDISQVRRELTDVNKIHIVVKGGECKEVLVEVVKDSEYEGVVLVDIDKDGKFNIQSFSSEELFDNSAPIVDEKDLLDCGYLYEPNAGLMKLNCSGTLCKRYPGMKKISPNTSLYIAKQYFKDFPGRIFSNLRVIQKRDQGSLKNLPLNVAVRNYPLSAADLKKKLKTKEGADDFLFGFRLGKKGIPQLIQCSRL